MGDDGVTERLHLEFEALVAYLEGGAESSLRVTADDCFRKVLLLCAASEFEAAVIGAILGFVSTASGENERVLEFVRRKAISRQYHALFDWDRSNASPFFGLFGDGFKRLMEEHLKGDDSMAEAIRSFLEIGRERNRLVHQNLGYVALEKTAEEIFEMYRSARRFVDEIGGFLRREGV